jgi:hypothetical protein
MGLAIRTPAKLQRAAEVKIRVAWFSDGPAALFLTEIYERLSTLGATLVCFPGHVALPINVR